MYNKYFRIVGGKLYFGILDYEKDKKLIYKGFCIFYYFNFMRKYFDGLKWVLFL